MDYSLIDNTPEDKYMNDVRSRMLDPMTPKEKSYPVKFEHHELITTINKENNNEREIKSDPR